MDDWLKHPTVAARYAAFRGQPTSTTPSAPTATPPPPPAHPKPKPKLHRRTPPANK